MAGTMWGRVAGLRLRVDRLGYRPLELATDGGWRRRTTVVRLGGDGLVGEGEDVTYDGAEQLAFQASLLPDGPGDGLPSLAPSLVGEFDLGEWSERLGALPLHRESLEGVSRAYRRWAFESAGLDLALRQNGLELGAVLGRRAEPVRFVLSLGLSPGGGAPSTLEPIRSRLERFPAARFKVDWAPDWTPSLVAQLGALKVVDVVDLKGHYRGAFEGPPPDPDGYRAVAEALPEAWLEDPSWDEAPWAALAPHEERVTWDAVLHGVDDLNGLPHQPKCVNIKPSRFGTIRELLAVYEWCEARGVAMYGGGQFELGPGRDQIQHLAALFHPAGPNDVAPAAFHRWPNVGDDVAVSPMVAPRAFGP